MGERNTHRIFKIHHGPHARAQHLALFPTNNWAQKVKKSAYFGMHEKLKHRLSDLRRLKLPHLQGIGWKVHANCPPPATYHEQSRPCHQYRICPWCWARVRVLETYNRCCKVIYGKVDHWDHAAQPCRDVDLYEYIEWDAQSFTVGCDEIITREHSKLTRLKPHFKSALGSAYLVTIEPVGNEWVIGRRMLSLIPGDMDLIDIGGCRHRHPINKDMLGQVVGRTFVYPHGMIEGPVQQAFELLNTSLLARKLFVYHGQLRRRKVAEEVL